MVYPDHAWHNWTATRLYCIQKDKQKALIYVKKAIEYGAKKNWFVGAPEFTFLKNESDYQKLIEDIQPF